MKTQLNDLFDQMEHEEGNTIEDKIKIELSKPTIIESIYENFIQFSNDPNHVNVNPQSIVLNGVSAKDITNFSLRVDSILENTPISAIGHYISNLINYSFDKNHLVIFEKTKYSLYGIGFENNGKKIQIIGDNITGIGLKMKSGEIIVEGNAGDSAGTFMKGGKLIVKGNLGLNSGHGMAGGEIIYSGQMQNKYGYLNYSQNEKGEKTITRKK